MMKRWILSLTALALLGVSVAVAGVATNLKRTDCPGTITCPITGEEVCSDQCPLNNTVHDDCPGTIACPLTGEEVCKDRCPLNQADQADQPNESELPACCRK